MNKKKLLIFSILFLAINIIVLFCFFPTLQIFGYEHQVLTSTNPDLYITITANNLFNVLKDNFYSTSLKFAYIVSFILQLISFISSLMLLFYVIFSKKTNYYIFIIPSIIWAIFLIILFKDIVSLLTVAILFFIISLSYIVYLLVTKKYDRRKNQSA